jgi:hypothetical protein
LRRFHKVNSWITCLEVLQVNFNELATPPPILKEKFSLRTFTPNSNQDHGMEAFKTTDGLPLEHRITVRLEVFINAKHRDRIDTSNEELSRVLLSIRSSVTVTK